MKTTSIIIFLSSIVCLCQAGTVIGSLYLYTPNGSPVFAELHAELPDSVLANMITEIEENFPEAVILSNATDTYNCHSYAWNMVEGGPVCWLDLDWHQNNYWHDGSYVETALESEADKIYYDAYHYGNHSAVKSLTHPGKYESKWGSGPLVRHDPEYGPDEYYYGMPNYYRRCTPINISTQTITVNRIITSPCDLNVQNVTVTNGAKLTLDAEGATILNGDFEVQIGSELEVK